MKSLSFIRDDRLRSADLFRRNLGGLGAKFGIKLTGFLPAHDVERFDELADAVDLGTEQAELDDLFIGKCLARSA